MSETWLLTGGAGFIGAHVLRALHSAGHDVVVLDDLSTGVRRKVAEGIPFVEASILDTETVTDALKQHKIDGVVHLAAKKAVGESVERPFYYYEQNVVGMMALLEAVRAADVHRFVLSSSAAVYGSPEAELVEESTDCVPQNPYGETKLIQEWLLRDLADSGYDLGWVALRYFNVAGAGSDDLGDTGVFNLIPMVLRALEKGQNPQVFGDDYPTRDGSCIRDFIHVHDLAAAHVAAATRTQERPCAEVLNVGRGQGFTVKEVMDAVRAAVGRDFDYDVVGRRAGDPAQIIADASRINEALQWRADRDLEEMVRSAWSAWQAYPPRV